MAHKLKNVREKFDTIAMEKNKFKLTEGVGENEADRFDWRITSSYVNKTEIIYGRDKEKEELINAMRVGAGGCSIIITTRLKPVADRMATIPVHQMGRLSEDDSRLLFERLAFGTRRRE
ncbi:hypothetical protein OIU74_027628, partial [Salix koriyanagi]